MLCPEKFLYVCENYGSIGENFLYACEKYGILGKIFWYFRKYFGMFAKITVYSGKFLKFLVTSHLPPRRQEFWGEILISDGRAN